MNHLPLNDNSPHFNPLPPIPIIEEPNPFRFPCNHKMLVLKNTEKYTYITRLNKIYTCVDCGNTFSMQPVGMKIFNNSFDISRKNK